MISKNLIKNMNGKLKIESEVHQGTKISFTIPAKKLIENQNILFNSVKKYLPDEIYIYESLQIIKKQWDSIFKLLEKKIIYINDLNHLLFKDNSFIILSINEEEINIDNFIDLLSILNQRQCKIFIFGQSSSKNEQNFIKNGALCYFSRPIRFKIFIQKLIDKLSIPTNTTPKIKTHENKVQLKILVAEDQYLNQVLIKKLFESYSFLFYILDDGSKAFEKAKK